MSVEPEPADGGAQPGPREEDAAHALLAAIAQLGLALRESQDPVLELGTLLTRLAETLAAVRSGASLDGLLEQMQMDVFKGIEHLQFYDRMVQHLSHLQDYLICVATELDPLQARPQSRAVWDDLHAKLRRRLISDEQRGLLDLYLMPDLATRVSAQAERTDYSPPGSLEMF